MDALIPKLKMLLAALPAVLMLAPAAMVAQRPQLTNAKIETRSASSGLSSAFRALVAAETTPAWIAYSVPANNSHQMCCFDYIGGRVQGGGCCRLEEEPHGSIIRSSDKATNDASPQQKDERKVFLESSPVFFVFVRTAGGGVQNKVQNEVHNKIQKIRTFSPDCQIDAGGLPVFWLTDVRSADSVEWLSAASEEGQPA